MEKYIEIGSPIQIMAKNLYVEKNTFWSIAVVD